MQIHNLNNAGFFCLPKTICALRYLLLLWDRALFFSLLCEFFTLAWNLNFQVLRKTQHTSEMIFQNVSRSSQSEGLAGFGRTCVNWFNLDQKRGVWKGLGWGLGPWSAQQTLLSNESFGKKQRFQRNKNFDRLNLKQTQIKARTMFTVPVA